MIIGTSLNNYFFEDDYIFNPIVTGDAGTLHLEGRYNYEDINTLSLFGGYNIAVGNELLWEVTPMIGVAFGETNGFIPAIESTLSYGAFEWYLESEYVVITDEGGDDYFYTWTELLHYGNSDRGLNPATTCTIATSTAPLLQLDRVQCM